MGRRRRRNRLGLAANKRKRLAEAVGCEPEAKGSIMDSKNHVPLECTDNEVEIKEEDLEADDEYITDWPIIKKIKLQENKESLPTGYEMYVIQGVNNPSEQFTVKPASPNGVGPNVKTKKKIEIKTAKRQNSNDIKATNTNFSLNSDKCSSVLAKGSQLSNGYKEQNLTPQKNTLNSIKPSTTSSVKFNNLQSHSIKNIIKQLGTSPAMNWYKRKFLSQDETFNNSKSSSKITSDSSRDYASVKHTKQLPAINYQHGDIGKNGKYIPQQNTCSKTMKTTNGSNNNLIHGAVRHSKTQPSVNYQNGDLSNKRKSFLDDTILNNREPVITTTATSSSHLGQNGKQDPLERTDSPPSGDLERVDSIPKVFDFNTNTTTNSDSFHDYWSYDDPEQQNSLASTTYGDLNENSQDSDLGIGQTGKNVADTSTASTTDSTKTKKQAAEKERRTIISNLFYELKSLLPVDATEGRKKIAISAKRRYLCPRKLLMRTCDYIRYMQGTQDVLQQCIKENENLRLNNQCMQKVLFSLQSKLQSNNQELGAIVNTEGNKKDT